MRAATARCTSASTVSRRAASGAGSAGHVLVRVGRSCGRESEAIRPRPICPRTWRDFTLLSWSLSRTEKCFTLFVGTLPRGYSFGERGVAARCFPDRRRPSGPSACGVKLPRRRANGGPVSPGGRGNPPLGRLVDATPSLPGYSRCDAARVNRREPLLQRTTAGKERCCPLVADRVVSDEHDREDHREPTVAAGGEQPDGYGENANSRRRRTPAADGDDRRSAIARGREIFPECCHDNGDAEAESKRSGQLSKVTKPQIPAATSATSSRTKRRTRLSPWTMPIGAVYPVGAGGLACPRRTRDIDNEVAVGRAKFQDDVVHHLTLKSPSTRRGDCGAES